MCKLGAPAGVGEDFGVGMERPCRFLVAQAGETQRLLDVFGEESALKGVFVSSKGSDQQR